MNKIDVLKEYKDILNHNLFCYSADYLMNTPKKQYVKEWEATQEKIGLIEEIMEDVKQHEKEIYEARDYENEETEELE